MFKNLFKKRPKLNLYLMEIYSYDDEFCWELYLSSKPRLEAREDFKEQYYEDNENSEEDSIYATDLKSVFNEKDQIDYKIYLIPKSPSNDD